MLLDFHLARGPIEPGEWVSSRLGGTPGWMSPEQEAALDAVRAGVPCRRPLMAAPTSTRWGCCCGKRSGGPERTRKATPAAGAGTGNAPARRE